MIDKGRQCTQSRQWLAHRQLPATITFTFRWHPLTLNQTPLLAADALCFERQGQAVFGPLGFSLPAGGLLQVSGSNGSGKTTLLRVLAGLARPSSGELFFDGQPASSDAYPGRGLAAYRRMLDWILANEFASSGVLP